MTSRHPAHDCLLDSVDQTDNPRLMQTVLRYMDGLRRSIEGDELYGLIARILRRHSRAGTIGAACFAELYTRLGEHADDPVTLPMARIKARLLQQHILPYLPEPAKGPIEVIAVSHRDVEHGTPSRLALPREGEGRVGSLCDSLIEGTLEERPPPLTARRELADALQRSEQDAWRAIHKVATDFGALKELWNQNFEELTLERQRLAQKLDQTEQTLQTIESNCQQLRTDLASAQRAPARKVPRRLPRSTSARLVSREAFLQQLQAEVSRIMRTGNATTLAMLGVRELETIAQQFGDGADSAVLSCYAREILSGFRAYDIVGRYADHVFIVLLPDTDRDGAVRALEKAQKRTTVTHVNYDGRRFPLPGFCGALSAYNPGEDLAAWLQRTESAVSSAREKKQTKFVVT